jgi:soluble lytic murein transglycosylase
MPLSKNPRCGQDGSLPRARVAPALLLLFLAAACAHPAVPKAPTITATPAVPTATIRPTLSPTTAPTSTPAPDQHLALGDRALLYGDYDAARENYSAALAAGVESGRAAFYLARVLVLTGDFAGARTTLESLIAASPAGDYAARANFLLGEIAAELSDNSSSIAAYQKFLLLAPGLLPDVAQESVGDSSLAAGLIDQAMQAYDAAASASDPANALRLREKEANTLRDHGSAEAAMALYESVLGSVTSDAARARLNRKIGNILIALDRKPEGYASFQTALQYPAAYDAYLCLADLIDAGFAVDGLTRGVIDFYAGQYAFAVANLSNVIAANPAAADAAKARYFRGLAYRVQDQPQEAAADFDAAAALGADTGYWDQAIFESADTRWAWLDDYAGAVAILAGFADASPTHARAAEALFTAGRIAERGNDLPGAAKLWNRAADAYPADANAAEARHQAGIALYRAGDYAGAETAFRALDSSSDSWTRSRALFWTAKTLEKRGDSAGARSMMELAAAASPTDYYSVRAADRIAGREAFTRAKDINLVFDLDAEYSQAEAWVQTVFALQSSADLEQHYALARGDPHMLRGQALWDLGLYDSAEGEFDALWLAAAKDPAESLYLSRYLLSIGYYSGGIQAARKVLDDAGLTDAQTLAAPAYFNHVRFGPYFAELVVPQAVQYTIDPLLLFSVVRQESLFGISAVSSANAHGLMQLIPTTAQEVAGKLGLTDLSQSDLYRPMINLKLGSKYLAMQRDGFSGDWFLALAAYNAGAGSAAVWQTLAGGDDDLLLEVIRADETRNYIRRIYENYAIYRDLYQVQ